MVKVVNLMLCVFSYHSKKKNGEIKTILEFLNSRSTLQDILKGFLQAEMKGYYMIKQSPTKE